MKKIHYKEIDPAILESRNHFRSNEPVDGIVSLIDGWHSINSKEATSQEEIDELCELIIPVRSLSSGGIHIVCDFKAWVLKNGFSPTHLDNWLKKLQTSDLESS